MATKILLKKSVTSGASPLTSDLDQGELAVNLVDKKIYTKDSGNNITRLDGAYVDAVAPANPVEGDIWYDTVNNLLKAYDGSSFQSAGYQTLSALEDTTITSAANGEYLRYNGSAWVNSDFETDAEALFSAANTGTGHGDLSYANGVFTYDRVTSADVRGDVSAAHTAATLGDFQYDQATGVFTHTGVTQEEIEDITAGQLVTNGTHTNITASYDDAGDGAIDLEISDATIRSKISLTDAGGDGSMSYDAATGVITYNGPTAAEVTAHFTGGTGITHSAGDISIDFTEFTLDDISEAASNPTNLFYTDERVDDRVATLLVGGTNLETVYDDAAGTLTLNAVVGLNGYDLSGNDTTDLAEGNNLYYTDARARAAVSATDAGGDGSFTYDSATGVFTYTGPSAAEVRAHVSGGTGVTYSAADGIIHIGQEVETTSDVTFNSVETALIDHTGDITINPDSGGASVDDGTVTIQGNLTVTGTTTTVNSNEVNIGDSIILLNSDETGAPSQNAGFEVERGTDANKSFVWNEADDAWDLSDETLQNVVIDGGTY